MSLNFDYFYGNEAEQYAFYRIPKLLITSPMFKKVSDSAKLLYGLMLDRMCLSMKNGWVDEDNRAYIFFTTNDVMELMNCGTEKATKMINELEKGIGLIERKKQGQGKPALVYLKKFYIKDDNHRKCRLSEIVLGVHETRPNMFVAWECTDIDNYHWGHYTTSLLSPQKDFCERALNKIKFYEQNKKKKEPEPER